MKTITLSDKEFKAVLKLADAASCCDPIVASAYNRLKAVEQAPTEIAFRNIDDPKEYSEFKRWAQENYQPGDPIKSIWHPIVKDECDMMNKEHGL